DLKIVKILRSNDKGNSRSCYVFSLSTGVWSTPLELAGNYRFTEHKGLFVNGFLYWMSATCSSRVILAFDVKDMVFSKIQSPCARRRWTMLLLGTLKGRLA
ncbi:F-box domain containing protein, partial [Tanacetum coccineum]